MYLEVQVKCMCEDKKNYPIILLIFLSRIIGVLCSGQFFFILAVHSSSRFQEPSTLKIINLSKWCLKRQVSKFANLNAIFLLDDSQMLITYYSD